VEDVIETQGDEFDASELTEGDPKPEPDEEREEGEEGDPEDLVGVSDVMRGKKADAKPEPPKTYKAKANGREVEIPAETADALAKALGLDVQDLLRGSQMARAGQERLRAAAEVEKKARSFEERIKKDPRGAFAEALGGRDAFLRLAIEEVAKLAEEEELAKTNPVELERRKLAVEREKLDAERKASDDAKKSVEQKEYEERFAAKLDGEIKAALEAGKLPRDPYVVKRLASAMADHFDKTGEDPDDLSAADLAPLVAEEIQAEHEAFLGKLSGEEIVSRFPGLAEKVRKALVSRVEGRGKPPARQPQPTERQERNKPKERRFASASAALASFTRGD
jgi:hypothetical protein